MNEPSPAPLERVRVVLVETTHPGNVGAVARAMKTMGLTRLHLVRPRHPLNADAVARASGADDVLASARWHEDLPDALKGCRFVVGSSARLRTVDWPLLDPRECADRLVSEAKDGDAALVFGRESSGLTNAELAICHYLVRIPANPAFSSLNLAAAVQVLSYEIYRSACRTDGDGSTEVPRDLATADAMEGFYAHLAQTLVDVGFSDPQQSNKLLRRLRRLFNRARPDWLELNIMRGILSAAQGKKTPERFVRTRGIVIAEPADEAENRDGRGRPVQN
jgi:tRNA (cytidine32/uridine32-2'-O)-methyltransferase